MRRVMLSNNIFRICVRRSWLTSLRILNEKRHDAVISSPKYALSALKLALKSLGCHGPLPKDAKHIAFTLRAFAVGMAVLAQFAERA
jgi:hypothetical protein